MTPWSTLKWFGEGSRQMTCKLDPFFLFFVSWRCWTKHGTASRFAVNTQRWIHSFHAHSAGSCFTWTHKLQDASRNPQAKWLPGNHCTSMFICFAIWNCHGKCLCNSCIRLPSRPDFAWQTVEKSMGVPGIQSGWTVGWQGARGPNFKVHDPSVCAKQCSWKMQSIRTCKQQASWPLYFEMSISGN